jgi:MOSC domain-containing protein YiiM
MQGRILQVNVSPGGLPKRPVPLGIVTPLGLEGDGHRHPRIHGGARQALLLLAAEVIEDLHGRGYPVEFGSLGENLTTRGLDPARLRIDQILRAGGALIQLTKVRAPCAALDPLGAGIQREIYDARVKAGDVTSPRWGWSGFYARVLETGVICPGDPISVEATFA